MTKQQQNEQIANKEKLNSTYGVKRSGKLPKTPAMQYVQAVISEYLKQQREENKNESE